MSDSTLYDTGAPNIEVRVFRDGEIIERELCESEDEANLVIERFADQRGISFEVEDLSNDHWPGEILGSESVGFGDDAAPEPVLPEQGGGA